MSDEPQDQRLTDPSGCVHRFKPTTGAEAMECRRYPPTTFLLSSGGMGPPLVASRFPPCAARCGEFDAGIIEIPPVTVVGDLKAAMETWRRGSGIQVSAPWPSDHR